VTPLFQDTFGDIPETFYYLSPYYPSMSDTKRKISAWIPATLYEKIEKAGYTSPTVAVTKGLELLVRAQSGDSPDTIGDKAETSGDSVETVWTQLETENKSLKNEIERLSVSLQGAPDPREFSRLQARSEELERHNSTLKEELDKASQREEDLKSMHNNYMLQVQSLINQKAIEAPGEKKKWWKFW
jgi:hypothetical protein